MNAAAKRAIGLSLAVVLIVGIVLAVFWGRLLQPGDSAESTQPSQDLTVVNGVIGSEKKPFFDDPAVAAVFAENGLEVRVVTAGSRQIATGVDLAQYDFAFPSSAPAAEKIRRETGASTVYAPFYSPMAIATFQPIVELLQAGGLASQDAAGTWHLDLAAYLAAVEAGTRWSDLPGAGELYPSSRSVLISSTDIRQSNSAAMYLSMASYVANDRAVVSSPDAQDAVIDELAALYLEQGFSASSSEAPFEDYLSQGIGSKPMVMIYEAQFLGRQMSETGSSAITDQMLLMYPEPTVLSKHTVVPLTGPGDEVGRLLAEDPRLAELAARYGFRPADATVFRNTLTERGVAIPEDPVDVVEPPSYETLESMISEISDRYTTPPPPVDSEEGEQ
ncbi:hypothetical protein ACEXQD_10530 [Herbiconiux sp. P15]|uniref:hypothetical protein n=1 Tax=Herbiconiux liukaitaii TaxID=3342799 RepID=UPI0035B73832